ncbi:MAG: RDD family protein [Synergistaceae bacterium]|jgi:uncharacterized RDD family membrane protein YckC|nr:RDD family protein [Synergistaceae bacterium]
MASKTDRVEELFHGVNRPARTIVSPEGVELTVRLASRGERMAAFALDMVFMIAAIVALYIIAVLLFFARVNIAVGLTLIFFLSFVIRNMYFLHFELAWQGRTPGKKICGIRVISRKGGELKPSSIIARNLMREVEFFLPAALAIGLRSEMGGWSALMTFGWSIGVTALPFFNRDRLRAGDFLGGTMVIMMPKRALLKDLSLQTSQTSGAAAENARYSFTQEQLAVYGSFELQVLEECLRRPQTAETDKLLGSICAKILRKIGYADTLPPHEIRRFLGDFYSAQRGTLERGQLFGHFKDDKTSR